MDIVGADGTRGGWVAVALTNGKFAEARLFEGFRDVVRAFPQAAVITVDIPIGLPTRGRRQADEKAREVLGDRRNSVFFAPPRPVLEANEFKEAVRIARSLDSSVSKQSHALARRIFEVECLASDRRIIEIHPEVSFWAMNGQHPLPYGKDTWNGLMKRLELLRGHGVELPYPIDGIGKAGADDVIDAAVAAWSAWRVARSEARSFPDSPQTDQKGRSVAIWY